MAKTLKPAPTGSYSENGFEFFDRLIEPSLLKSLLNMIVQVGGNSPTTFRGITRSSNLTNKKVYELDSANFVPLDTMIWGITPFIAERVGKPLLPTKSTFRVYQKGDICRIHCDNSISEHGLSMMIGNSDNKPWGLSVGHEFIADPMKWRDTGKTVPSTEDYGEDPYSTCDMSPGDAVLYQGNNRRHGRLDPNPNRWSAHLFMFWVDRDGPNKSEVIDERQNLPNPDYTF